jgi:hypothetical protein
MNRLSITTPQTGLIFQITIRNTGTNPLMVGYSNNDYNNYYAPNPNSIGSLSIYVQLQSSTNTENPLQTNSISFGVISNYGETETGNELYLPPNTTEIFYIEFAQSSNSLPIGSYTAYVLCYVNSAPTYGNDGMLTGGTPIDDSPFTFQIESPQVLQQKIAQNPMPQGSNLTFASIVLIILISAFLGVVLSLVLIYVIIPRTKFKEKFADKTKKKYQLSELATAITIVLTIIQIILALK